MKETGRNWIKWVELVALCVCVCTVACAQPDPATPHPLHAIQIRSPQTGSLSGRLTDLHSAPLAGVQVLLRNQATGTAAKTTTAKNGAFSFASLDAGEYSLEADAPQLGQGRLEGIFINGGMEARVQAAIRFEPTAPALLEAAAPNQIAAPARAAPMPLAANAPPGSARAAAPPVPMMVSASPSTTPRVSAPLVSAPPAPSSVPAVPSPPRMTAPSRPSVAVSASVATPLPAAPSSRPGAPRPALNTVSAALTASIAAEPLQPLPLTALALPPSAPTPSLNTVSPSLITSIDAEPMRPMPLPASRTAEIAQPAEQPFTPARTRLPAVAPPAASSGPRARAELETQSAAAQPVLAVALPHAFPLKAGFAPDLSASMAVTNGIKMLMRLKLPHLAPILAAVERVEPVTPAVASTVTATQLQALPASGRRWQEFLLDTPAASTSADSSQASFRASQESAEITIDGVSTRQAFGVAAGSAAGSQAADPSGQGGDRQSSMSQTWNGGRGLGVSEAAIREVTTAAGNVEAEGLRSAGGRTSIRTESGGDTLHGQGFFFDRQNTWGARNPFTQWVTTTSEFAPLAPYNTTQFPVFDNFRYSSDLPGSPESYTPPDHEIVWGVGVGSHIRRDKLFWFAALDSDYRNDPAVSMVKHPYLEPSCETPPCSPTGFFAAPSDAQMRLLSAQLDLSSANPVAEGLTAYSQMLGQLASLLGPAPRTAAQWTGFGRIDWQAAEHHRFTFEGVAADRNAPGGGLTRVSEDYGSHSFGSSQASQEWLLARWEAYLTPNMLSVTQGSAGRTILTARPGTPSAFEQTFLTGNSWGQLPQIVVDNRYGFTIGNPSRFGQGSYPDERLYHAQEMLDWVHNKLLVKAGFELDHNADATSLLRNQTGTYSYSKVQNFISDALVFESYGIAPNGWKTVSGGQTFVEHNCNPPNNGLGALPCYSHYSQTIGPTDWHLSTNDWAGYVTAQWQLNKIAVFSAGLRWEREQLPPPIALVNNPELSLTEKLPSLGNNWGPRLSVAMGSAHSHWPVLRLGYGMYYGRVANATIETALTQTGSLKGDLNIFIRPTDGYTSIDGTSGAPFFPNVLTSDPASVVKPGAVEFAPNFRNPEVHQAVAAIEQPLPGRIELTAGAMLSLGRRLPVNIDTNLTPPTSSQTITYTVCDEVPTGTNDTHCGQVGLGPITAATITVPFYASWPSEACPMPPIPPNTACGGWNNASYQEIDQITSMANSTYEAAMVKITRYGQRGLSLHAHYTYAHAMDWNPNESPMDPANFSEEYGTSNQDVRHSGAAMVIYEAPWKLHGLAGRFGNGWMLSGIGQFHSGLPYTMRVTGSLPEERIPSGTIVGLRPGMNGSGGDNRIYWIDGGNIQTIGRNTFRYPDTWKADLRLGKKFDLGETRQLEVMAESFNLFNHQNVTEIETTGYTIESGSSTSPPTLNFLTGLKTNPKTGLPIPGFGQPLNINGSDFYRERQIQLGLRMRF